MSLIVLTLGAPLVVDVVSLLCSARRALWGNCPALRAGPSG